MAGYEPRTYRHLAAAEDLVAFHVAEAQTDLHIQASAGLTDLEKIAREAVREARRAIETEIILVPSFATSLAPLAEREGAPRIVGAMYHAGSRAQVGPMASVAGAIAEFVGRRLLEQASEAVVENGGDVFLCTGPARTVAVYAGRSPLSGKVGLRIPAGETLGVCTSSATVGPSYSAGKADAALIVADDTAFADAMASNLGNSVQGPQDVEAAVTRVASTEGVRQALVILGSTLGVAGEFELVKLR